MKKIYLFLTMLFALGTSAFAQSSNAYEIMEDEPLIASAEQITSPYTETSEGSIEGMIDQDPGTFWHSTWSGGAVEQGLHYFQVEMPDGDYDLIAFVYTRRNVANDQTTRWGVRGTNDPDAAKDACELIAEIETPLSSTSETLPSPAFNPSGYKYLRFYCEATQGSSEQYNNRGYFHVAEFQLYPAVKLDDAVVALKDLEDARDKYLNYSGTFVAGTEPGLYDPAAIEAFEAALEAANQLLDYEPGNEPDAEVSKAATEALIAAYEAVIASRVPFTIADGYYRIRGAMTYVNDFDTGEKDDEGNAITEAREVWKYMLISETDDAINGRWGTPEPLENDAPSIWKITARDGYYDIVSVATDARFNEVATSTAITLSKESQNLMAIEAVGSDDEGQVIVNIRVSTQDAGNYYYIHQGGHSSGAGVSGNLVGWSSTYSEGAPAASEWMFVPVTEDEVQAALAAYAILHDHDVMVADFEETLANAKTNLKIAKDISANVDFERPLVNDPYQFDSPYTEASEGSIEALLDGDTGTFWHSAWSGGSVAGGTHYLQVELVDNDVVEAAFQFTRRAVANDHITEWGVYGTNDPGADKADCEVLAGEILTPYGSNTETLISEPFPVKGYQYLRFYINHTTTERGYGHMSEFQLYPAEVIDPATSQYKVMGNLASDLEAIVEELSGINTADLTADQYNALKSAYDAFMVKFVDPTELRQAIEAAKAKTDIVTIGEQPGFWTDESCIASLTQAIEEAEAYDEAGDYTPEHSTELIAKLQAADSGIAEAAIGVQTDKWYRIRFGTLIEFEDHEWDLVAGNAPDNGTSEELFGKYVTVADLETDEGGNNYLYPAEGENITLGKNLYLDAEEDIDEKDYSLFRFIAVADTAYLIQNKATGMFIKAAGTSGAVSLSVHPSLFGVRAIGYGLNVFPARTLAGEAQSFLHAQVAQNILVTWNVDYPGSRSGFFIEEADAVEADYSGSAFRIALEPGSLSTFCFPMDVAAETGMYTVEKVEDGTVTLIPITKAAAGRPFVFIYGDTETYDSETEDDLSEPVDFTHGYDLVAEPQASDLLKGTFASQTVGAGVIVAEGNKFVVTRNSGSSVGANRAYISDEAGYDTSAEVAFVIGEGDDNVAAALANVAKGGDLYNVEGQLLRRGANLNDLRTMGRGIYILNGTKVVVK
mgnify:CR=1 FL=1